MKQDIFLFAGHDFYPLGGYEDFRRSFYTIEEAKEWVETNLNEAWGMDQWAHLVKDNEIIIRGSVSNDYHNQPIIWKWKNEESSDTSEKHVEK